MGIKISEMTAVANATGAELLPASVSDAPRRVSVDQVKNYTLAAAAAVTPASGVSTGNGVFILQGGALKPVDVDAITQRAIDIVWAKTAESAPAGSGTVPLKEGTTEKTLTLANLAVFVRDTIRAAVLNPATLDASGAVTTDDVFVIGQSGVAKKITLTDLRSAVLAGLKDYVTALTAITAAADTDEFYAIQGGVQRKVTFATLKAGLGVANAISAESAVTADYVPQWGATSKLLKEGVPIVNSVRAAGTAGNGLPTEAAVRSALNNFAISLIEEEKTTLVAADQIMLSDSADEDQTKRASVGALVNVAFDGADHTSLNVADKIPIVSGTTRKSVSIQTLDSRFGSGVAANISLDASGFDGNLDGEVTNVQALADAVDHMEVGGGGGGGADGPSFSGVVEIDYSEVIVLQTTHAGCYIRVNNTDVGALGIVRISSLDGGDLHEAPVGTVIELEQSGVGPVCFASDGYMTLLVSPDRFTDTQYMSIRAVKIRHGGLTGSEDGDVWIVKDGVANPLA